MSEFAKDVDGRTDGGARRVSSAAHPSSGDPTVSPAATRWSVGVIQAKLVVGAIDDALEREADRVAATVVSDLPRQRGPGLLDSVATTRIRSRSDFALATPPRVTHDWPVTRIRAAGMARGTLGEHGGALDDRTGSAIERARGGGRPLDEQAQRSMGGAFGSDFSAVRIHDDADANDLSTRIQAKAFTTGTDIFFGRGEFRPATRAGQELLAHELAHVMQQAEATRTGGGAGGDGGPATSAPSSPRVLRKFDGALGKMSMSEVMEQLRATYQKVPVQWKVEQLLTLTDSSNTPVTFNTIKEIGDHFHLAALDTTSTATMAGSGLPQAVVTSGGATAMVAGGVAPTKVRALPSIPPSTTQPQAGRTQGLPSMITPREPDKSPTLVINSSELVSTSQPKGQLPPSNAVPEGVRSAIRSASEMAQAEAIKQVSAKQAQKIELKHTAEPKTTKTHQTVKAGGAHLIINNVWLGDGQLGALDKFNLYSWRALGHSVNIFAHRFDGKVPTLGDLGLESGDATVINLTTLLGEDDSAKAETPAGSFGSARSILKSWLSHPRSKDDDKKKVHLYNMIDLTKSYIGGTRRGIVLDMKVGPSLHLQDYAGAFHQRMISYTRGGNTLGPENQSIGTMQETDELRKLYSESFNKTLTDKMKAEPEETWFGLFTATHGRSYANTKKWLDTAVQMPSGKNRPEKGSPYSVSEPGSSPGHGPFRVFKDASDQTNKSAAKTKPSQVKSLANAAVGKELQPSQVDEAFLAKARKAMEALPSS